MQSNKVDGHNPLHITCQVGNMKFYRQLFVAQKGTINEAEVLEA